MLPVTLCKKFPDCEAGDGVPAKGALPVKIWLAIETVAALAPCENAQSPKTLAAKTVEWYDFIIVLFGINALNQTLFATNQRLQVNLPKLGKFVNRLATWVSNYHPAIKNQIRRLSA
jgi:hypothetical protein